MYIELLIKFLLATTVTVSDENFRFFSKAYYLVFLDNKALVVLLTDLTPKCYIFMDKLQNGVNSNIKAS